MLFSIIAGYDASSKIRRKTKDTSLGQFQVDLTRKSLDDALNAKTRPLVHFDPQYDSHTSASKVSCGFIPAC